MHCNVSCSICLRAMPQCVTRPSEEANKDLESSILQLNLTPLQVLKWVFILSCQAVCPHNPIILDKIFHYPEYFAWVPIQTRCGSRCLRTAASADVRSDSKIHFQGYILHQSQVLPLWSKWLPIWRKLWAVVVSKVEPQPPTTHLSF